jgi:hypothetical protein
MPDAEKKTEHKPAPKPVLGDAAASTDPAVHQALAEREIAQRNLDAANVEEVEDAAKAAQAQIDAIDKRLADLGVSL